MSARTRPAVPALVVGRVGHTRRTPFEHRFRYRVYQWLVDVDDLPRMPRWLRAFSTFRAQDHVGDPDATIRANIEAVCAEHDIDVTQDRLIMLANARVLGHTFDPLSVFWALDAEDRVHAIVAEVHNTYGERHCYVLRPDDDGRATTTKDFYVSPFFTVDGHYDLRFRLGSERVSSTIVLRQGGQAVFSATSGGAVLPATPARLARVVLTHPFMTQRVSLAIRVHGVWLWLRRLPVVARRPHQLTSTPPQDRAAHDLTPKEHA